MIRKLSQYRSFIYPNLYSISSFHQQSYSFNTFKNQKLNIQAKRMPLLFKNICYPFCLGFNNKQEGKITSFIQAANSVSALKNIFKQKKSQLNIISRTALLRKITGRPFDTDQSFIKQVIQDIQKNWHEYESPNPQNSRAVANTICYLSRNAGRHQLDDQFKQINYMQLFKYTNNKQFVMVVTGLLKLQLIDKIKELSVMNPIQTKKIKFDLQTLFKQIVTGDFHPGLLVSLWRHIIRSNKTNRNLNNFFAQKLQTKHLKKYIKDYAYFVYCYSSTLNDTDIDLSYTFLAYPKDIQIIKNNRLQAHQFSLMCQNLVQIQKHKSIYLDQNFLQLLNKNYISIVQQNQIPLRNVSNCLSNFMLLNKPKENIIYHTFNSFKRVLQSQIKNNQQIQKKTKKSKVDAMSLVFVFDKLVALHEDQFQYFDKLTQIVFRYILMIAKNGQLSKYPEVQFLRLMNVITQTKKKVYQHDNSYNLQLSAELQQLIFIQIVKRSFQPKHFSFLMGYISTLEMRSKQFCQYALKNIKKIDSRTQKQYQLDVRLQQKCIVNKMGHKCLNCFKQK